MREDRDGGGSDGMKAGRLFMRERALRDGEKGAGHKLFQGK